MSSIGLLTEHIKAEVHHLGFALVGVTQPSPPPHYDVFLDWLRTGRHGEMAYLAYDRARRIRSDPAKALPGCRSVIVLGLRYPDPVYKGQKIATPTSANTGVSVGRNPGLVASYAWGSDYHEVIPPRLRALSSFISDQVSVQINSRIYTDTGPILERELAQHAGLGWIGKNTCLIHPKLGSYFLLAELFLDIPLEPDPPFLPDRCGNCTRCIQACPTACILPDRTIDSRRCISYLTIELKKIIPMSLRPLMGPWIFGCDICQAVCPWNVHFAEGPGSIKPDSALAPRPGLPIPDLLLELALSSHAFNQKFRGNPIQRPHRRGYLRNVAIALGNSSDPSAIPVLVETLLRDPEPLVRGASAWALGQIGGSVAHQILSTAMSSETSEAVLHEIDTALHKV